MDYKHDSDKMGCNDATRKKKRKKGRKKAKSRKDYCRDIPEDLCELIDVSAVKRKSGATLETCSSSCQGNKTWNIRGTRSQILKALRMVGEMTGLKESDLEKAHIEWLDWVQNAFPELESRSYFLPPVFIRRVPMAKRTFAGQDVFVIGTEDPQNSADKQLGDKPLPTPLPTESHTLSVQMSDVIDDKALQRMFYSLQKISEFQNEVFVCLSQFPFGSYLGEPCFAPAAAHLPLPSNLPSPCNWSCKQGDFDLLVIHKNYGFVICEIKTIGYVHNHAESNGEQRKEVAQKLTKASEQLDKAEDMLLHLVSDIASSVRITKTIACPNLSSHQLQETISNNHQLEKVLRESFHLEGPVDFARLILCSDHLPPDETPQSISETNLKKLLGWWQERVAGPEPDKILMDCPGLYKNVVARFCGPASTVKVPSITEPRVSIKTLDQAVSHVGDCYTAHMILFPEQIEVLSRAARRVFIVGPPGTGKTTVLLLMATEWLRQGNHVYVLSTWERSLAVTFMLVRLLQEILDKDLKKVCPRGKVRFLKKNFKNKRDMEDTVDQLITEAAGGSVHVIADEVGPDLKTEHHAFSEFCAKILNRLPKGQGELHLWAASCYDYVAPEGPDDGEADGWELTHFARPLRSPPAVLQEVKKAIEIKQHSVCKYAKRGAPDHGNGPPVKWIYHRGHQMGRRSLRVEDCLNCGKMVACFLLDDLRLKKSHSSPKNSGATTKSKSVSPCLHYKDVFILSWVELDENACILQSLREAEVPVRVMRDSDIEDVATASSDVVWAARQQLVGGLKRKVIVVLDNYDDSHGQYVFTRLRAMSRCSSQLVVVCPPPGYEQN